MNDIEVGKNDIEVGEYVRTEDGEIGKVRAIISEGVFINNNQYYYRHSSIVSHSKNLFDLIKVGDIIHYKIINISTTLEAKGYIEGITDVADNEMLEKIKSDENYIIKSILTKEQFKQAELIVN